MKKVIVTGATGFIGRHLIQRLAAENWIIYAVVREGRARSELLPDYEGIEQIYLDMPEYGRLDELVRGPCDDYVSLAWDGTRGGKGGSMGRGRRKTICILWKR